MNFCVNKIREFFDLKTSGVLGGTGAYFATVTVDSTMHYAIGGITLLIGILKLVEMFTGRKISELTTKTKDIK